MKNYVNFLIKFRDHFNFAIVNFPNLNGNIPRSHSYGVFTAQLIRYAEDAKYTMILKIELNYCLTA